MKRRVSEVSEIGEVKFKICYIERKKIFLWKSRQLGCIQMSRYAIWEKKSYLAAHLAWWIQTTYVRGYSSLRSSGWELGVNKMNHTLHMDEKFHCMLSFSGCRNWFGHICLILSSKKRKVRYRKKKHWYTNAWFVQINSSDWILNAVGIKEMILNENERRGSWWKNEGKVGKKKSRKNRAGTKINKKQSLQLT